MLEALLWGVCVVVFVHEKENWVCWFFPPPVTPLSTMLWSRAVMYPERGALLHISWSGYIWFKSRPREQESTSDSPCLVEWKFRNVTNRGYYMAARKYEISPRVLKKYFTTARSERVKNSSTQEEKFRISKRPCNQGHPTSIFEKCLFGRRFEI